MKQATTQQREYTASYPLMAGIITLVIWSNTPIANKIAVAHMDGLTAGILRSMLAGLLALVVAICLKLSFPRSTSDRLLLFVSGITSFAVWPALLSIGIEHTSVGHFALITTLLPIFTVLMGAFVQKKIPKSGWWIGATIAFLATAVLIFYQHDLSAAAASVEGDLIVLCGAIICSIGYIAGGKLSPKIGTSATTFWGLAISLLATIPIFITVSGNTDWINMPNEGWYAIVWLSLLSSLLGYALWFYALGHGGTGRIGSLLFLMPVLTLFFAYFILDEIITVFVLLICLCIIFGTYYAQKNVN